MRRISVSRHSEYCIFKVSNSPFWYANFWDFEKRAWSCRRSTGVLLEKPKAQAEKIARQLLAAGVLTDSGPDVGFLDYLNGFWQEGGEYVRKAKEVKEKPMSARYVKNCLGDIRLHLSQYTPFNKIRLSEITTGHIERWELWAKETHGISGSRVNACLKLIKIALGQAAKMGYISKNPALGVDRAAHAKKVKGILSQDEAAAVCALPLDNPRRLLSVLLGLCCGMRRGEVRGLQWADIQYGIINIRHNWIDGGRGCKEGVKRPKCDSARQVQYGSAVSAALDAVKATARHIAPDAFVLESLQMDGEPVSANFTRMAMEAALEAVGIPMAEQKRRNITYHSMRHSFITLARMNGIPDLTVQAWAGHASIETTNIYTHPEQVINYNEARDKMDRDIWTRQREA